MIRRTCFALLAAACLATTAYAADPPPTTDAGYVCLGACAPAGDAWAVQHFTGLPACTQADLAAPVAITAQRGTSVRATLPVRNGTPHFGPEVARITSGTRLQLQHLYVLGANPGEPRVVWAKVALPAHVVKRAAAAAPRVYFPTPGDARAMAVIAAELGPERFAALMHRALR